MAKDGVPIEVLARFDKEGRLAGGVSTTDGVTIKTAGDVMTSRDVIRGVAKKIERTKQLEKDGCPEVGIFWYGKNKTGKSELVSFGTPYKIGQEDEDFINFRLGHDKEWQHAKPNLADNYVEYYDPPRGRVLFRKSDGRFVVYLTRSIMTPVVKALVLEKFTLPKSTLFCKDEHYG